MLTDWLLRLRSFVKRDAVEQELDDELRFHLERLVESHVRNGTRAGRGHAPGAHRVRRARSNQGGAPPRTRHRLRPGSRPRPAPCVPAIPARSGFCGAHGALPRARHRRQHVHLRRDQCGHAAADAGRGAGPAGLRQPGRQPGLVVSRLSRGPGAHPCAVGARRDASDGVRPRRGRREQLRRRGSRVRQLRGRARAQALPGTLVRERPGTGGRHQPRGLGAPLPSRPGRGRPARSDPNPSRTRSSASRRANTSACPRRCERTSGCRSRRARGWPRNSRKAASGAR